MAKQLLRGSWVRLLGSLAALVIACSDSNPPVQTLGPTPSVGQPDVVTASTAGSSEFPSIPRLDVDLSATGSFRPGSPISIRATGIAKSPAAEARIDIRLTDGDPAASPAGEVLDSWTGSLEPDSRTRDLSAVVSFPRAGYYRVSAVVRNNPRPSDARKVRDTVLLDALERHLWIVIEDEGGRLTDGYDSTAVPDHVYPMFGSYGPFIQRPPETTASNFLGVGLFNVSVSGTFTYHDWDVPSGPTTGIPGAKVFATCLGGPGFPTYITSLTGLGGAYSVVCPAGKTSVTISMLLENTYAKVLGENGAMAGAFGASSGGTLNLQAANDYAARVFLDLALHGPAMITKFGFNKGQVVAWVSTGNLNYGPNWCSTSFQGCPGNDLIRTNFGKVFQQPGDGYKWAGLFVTVHEYGHSYHWYAVEPWSFEGPDCLPGFPHQWEIKNSLRCAFVEGIANWLAMTTIGSTIDHSPFGGDYGLEVNVQFYPAGFPTNPPPPPDNDGVLVEGSVASLLYDVIDNGSEADGPNNETGTTEPNVENLAAVPNAILQRLKYCRINGTITALSGMDQFVYCLEGNTSAYAVASLLSPAWRSYSTVSFDQGVPVLNSAEVRAAWEYNLYGIP